MKQFTCGRRAYHHRAYVIIFVLLTSFAAAQPSAAGTGQDAVQRSRTPVPRVLIVVAHPDDESCFAATVYEITHNLGGTVDQLVITNGEGGYRYSLLAESFYGVALTDEAIGRAALPEIRKRELLEAGHILGIANHFFLDQRDRALHAGYRRGSGRTLATGRSAGRGRAPHCGRQLRFCLHAVSLAGDPRRTQGGDHHGAECCAGRARAASRLCWAARTSRMATAQPSWQGFQSAGHPFSVLPQVFVTDRTVKFGFRNALDYQVIVNWVIAAHKSQGRYRWA